MTDKEGVVGILGGTSPLAPFLIDLLDHETVARFSRTTSKAHAGLPGASWSYEGCPPDLEVRAAISLMPVWELQHYFAWLREHGCRRLVVLSSTSRFTKTASSRPHDRELARRLTDGEAAVETWADEVGVSLTILRPTMVYGGPADGNVSEMLQLLRRFRAVPLVGSGSGRRQPVHMSDVAAAAASAIRIERTPRTAYDISGGEVLTYRQFLDRIRRTVDGPTFVLRVPGTPFRLLERTFPKSRRLSLAAGMVDRMGTDMVFDHSAARADLGHDPGPFRPQPGPRAEIDPRRDLLRTPSDANRTIKVMVVGQGLDGLGGVPTVARWLVEQLRADPAYAVEVLELATSSRDPNSRRLLRPRTWLRRSLRGPEATVGLSRWGANLPEIEAARYLPRSGLTAHLSSADVIHVVAGGPAIGRACLPARRPVVMQVATLSAWERVALGGVRQVLNMLNQPLVAAFERKALLRSSAVLVMNRQMADFVRTLGQRSVRIAPPGIDCTVFEPDEHGWRADGPLLSVSRLSDARKGLTRMLRSYEYLVTLMGDATPELILAGAGPVPDALAEELLKPSLRGLVRLLPDIDQADLPALYRSASCFLQASFEEGLGLSSIEAMASGVPVVSSGTAGSREVLDDAHTGCLVEEGPDFEARFAQAVLSVLESDGRAMSCAGRERALQLFSNEAAFATVRDVYSGAMTQSP